MERVCGGSHGGSDSYGHTAIDFLPSAFSGVSAVSTGSHVTDISRSHTPPERDMNSSKSSCRSNIGVGSTAENVSSQGLSSTVHCNDKCCFANSASINSMQKICLALL